MWAVNALLPPDTQTHESKPRRKAHSYYLLRPLQYYKDILYVLWLSCLPGEKERDALREGALYSRMQRRSFNQMEILKHTHIQYACTHSSTMGTYTTNTDLLKVHDAAWLLLIRHVFYAKALYDDAAPSACTETRWLRRYNYDWGSRDRERRCRTHGDTDLLISRKRKLMGWLWRTGCTCCCIDFSSLQYA